MAPVISLVDRNFNVKDGEVNRRKKRVVKQWLLERASVELEALADDGRIGCTYAYFIYIH